MIIGSGFAGLSAACFMAKAGWDVTVLEKHDTPGGRARQLKADGFTFDMGPSWYWMPDVFERFFECFGKKQADYYELKRLDPSYRVYWKDSAVDIPADYEKLRLLFDEIEPGSGARLESFLEEAKYKYEVGMHKLVHQPGRSITEFFDIELAKGMMRLDVFTSMKKHVAKYFKDPRLQELMEFPVLFLGAMAKDIPALYSLMNYADIKLGTWYPAGGMYSIVNAMFCLAKELGVKFIFNQNVVEIKTENNLATEVLSTTNSFPADVVIGAADYHFIEQALLQPKHRSYSKKYWDKRTMAPSCLLYYIGLNKKLEHVRHHSLFFDTDFELHGNEIYTDKRWPTDPLFYACASSVTDESVAPIGGENLFFLIPVAAGLTGDNEQLRDEYFEKILIRFENRIGQIIRGSIVYQKSYSVENFVNDYNAFKGNAYGLANTLKQTAVLKPKLRSKKLKNLFYTGQLTVPGPGVPPSLISGEVVAKEIIKYFGN
ncbi:MAG TPA: phytoene desaturase family protein [Ferruginibacter sp.]|nr:phytoene desaturase family protein [Ferruginibacter sp.]